MRHITIVSTTNTNGPDNFAPYVILTIDEAEVVKRIGLTEKLMGRRRKNAVRPTNLAFWSDDVVTIDWVTDLPPKWLSKVEVRKLERDGVIFTRKVIDPDSLIHRMARVEVSMSVFWDVTFGVECLAKHSDERYESNTIFYSNLKEAIAKEKK